MSNVSIIRQWADGEVLSIRVKADSSYPDELSEAVASAVRTYAEALSISTADVEDTTETP